MEVEDIEEEEVHTRSALNQEHSNIVYMNITDNVEYIKLKDALSFSEFQMLYVFLRVETIVDSYMSSSLQTTRNLVLPYLCDMEWYNAYIAHVQGGKEVWKQ